jgi:[acyl-carrier-protein] S-malonyltransferase
MDKKIMQTILIFQALDFIDQNKSDFGIRRTKRVPVSGAFHTSLMLPAVDIFREALSNVQLHNPRVPVYSNYDNKVYYNSHHVQKYLPRQISSAVKWEQSMATIFKDYTAPEYAPSVYECGPGSQLSAILRQVNGKAGKNAVCIKV